MKKLLTLGVVVGLAAAVNARIDAARDCRCDPGCWCKRPGLRHFRWLFPVGHSPR